MIFEKLAALGDYAALDPRFGVARAWIAEATESEPKPGRYELGEGVYALVQEYLTKAREETRSESHAAYIDIQYLAAGRERIEVGDAASLPIVQAYDADKDLAFHGEAEGQSLLLGPGDAAVFFPRDAHRPCIAEGAPAPVRKIVVKIPVARGIGRHA